MGLGWVFNVYRILVKLNVSGNSGGHSGCISCVSKTAGLRAKHTPKSLLSSFMWPLTAFLSGSAPSPRPHREHLRVLLQNQVFCSCFNVLFTLFLCRFYLHLEPRTLNISKGGSVTLFRHAVYVRCGYVTKHKSTATKSLQHFIELMS